MGNGVFSKDGVASGGPSWVSGGDMRRKGKRSRAQGLESHCQGPSCLAPPHASSCVTLGVINRPQT